MKKALRREHLATFVVTTIGGSDDAPTFLWEVDAGKRRDFSGTLRVIDSRRS